MSQRRFVSKQAVLVAAIFLSCFGVKVSVVNAQQSSNSLADSLIDATLDREMRIRKAEQDETLLKKQIEEIGVKLQSAEADLETLQRSRPVLREAWRNLEIGEFEENADFEKRRAEAKTKEEREFAKFEMSWKQRFGEREAQVRTLRIDTDAQLKRVHLKAAIVRETIESASWENPPVVARRNLTAKEVSLPRLNRETMTFESVVIPAAGVSELGSSRPGNYIVRIEEKNNSNIQIMCDSLATAKQFKEGFESGEIKCLVLEGLDSVGSESPIVVQREVLKEEKSYLTTENAGRAIGLLALGLLAQASGASPDQVSYLSNAASNDPKLRIQPNQQTVVVQPRKTIEGVRYHFQMSPETIEFVDKNGKPVENLSVVFVNNFVLVKEVLPNAQLGSRVLKPGDRIYRVGPYRVHDSRSLRSAVRSFGLGQTFDVTYTRDGSTEFMHYTADGGKPLGVILD